MLFARAQNRPTSAQPFSPLAGFCSRLSFWIMTWFLIEAALLTVIGTFFRGPGWSWVWPWSEYDGDPQKAGRDPAVAVRR